MVSRAAPVSFSRVTVAVAIAAYAATRAVAYSPLGGRHESPGPQIISDHGELLGVWVVAWVIVGVLAVVDLWTRRVDGLIGMVGMMGVWGASYAWAWVFSGFRSPDYLTIWTYWGPALVIMGLIRAVRARPREVTPDES